MSCLETFTAKEILNKHRERYLLINYTQAVKYETGVKLKIMENKYQWHLRFILIENAF